MKAVDYQVIIIGAGPGGYVSAIRAAQMGLRVALIDQEQVGGVCLNHGCIPTKTLVTSSQLFGKMKRAAAYGISVDRIEIDWEKVIARKNMVVNKLVKGVEFLLKKNKVTFINGTASLIAPHQVRIKKKDGSEQVLTGEHLILATGSRPASFPALGYNGKNVVTSKELLNIDQLPSRLVIIGGGVVGCEFASIFSALGVEVTIIELQSRLLPLLEEELSKTLTSVFKKAGLKVLTENRVEEVKATGDEVQVRLAGGEVLTADLVLLSLGRVPNTTGLGLEDLGVMLNEKGRVKVDDRMRTNLPWLYAIGDVTDTPFDLAHTASGEGIVAVENITGHDRKMDYHAVPNCVFTIPEMASVGLAVQEAEARGLQIKVGRFPMMASGKAVSMGETIGFVLMVAEAETGRILGVHIMGPHASDLIAEATIALNHGMTVDELAATIHAHPTLAETVMEAGEAVFGKAIHF
jgi:dihydrolipoamide dehydrogenase